jgi:hypothetical protein
MRVVLKQKVVFVLKSEAVKDKMMRALLLGVSAAAGMSGWTTIHTGEIDSSNDSWEFLDDIPPTVVSTDSNFLWTEVEDCEVRKTLPDHIITKYEEGTLSLEQLEEYGSQTIDAIISQGIARGIDENNLWSFYGGPVLMRSGLGLLGFRLAAALDLEGVPVDDGLSWACESEDFARNLKREISNYWRNSWINRNLKIASISELSEELVQHSFLAKVPSECVSVFGEPTIVAHRIYRQALVESMGTHIRTLRVRVDKTRILEPLLSANPLSLRLARVIVNFSSGNLGLIEWLGMIERELFRYGVFKPCNQVEVCLNRTVTKNGIVLARAAGKSFALRTVLGLGWGVSFPKSYLEALLGPAPIHIDNPLLESMRQSFTEIVSLDHIGDFRGFVESCPIAA